jgi:hypothetical protein
MQRDFFFCPPCTHLSQFVRLTLPRTRYSTFRGLLHYLYTDSIQFAPLASTYYAARDHAVATDQLFPWPPRRAFLVAHSPQQQASSAGIGPGQAAGPCSAKAIYRLADKMGLAELKERAYEHIVQSLTPQNVCLFLRFSPKRTDVLPAVPD